MRFLMQIFKKSNLVVCFFLSSFFLCSVTNRLIKNQTKWVTPRKQQTQTDNRHNQPNFQCFRWFNPQIFTYTIILFFLLPLTSRVSFSLEVSFHDIEFHLQRANWLHSCDYIKQNNHILTSPFLACILFIQFSSQDAEISASIDFKPHKIKSPKKVFTHHEISFLHTQSNHVFWSTTFISENYEFHMKIHIPPHICLAFPKYSDLLRTLWR